MKNLLLISIILCSNWVLGQNKSTQTFSGNFENGTATYSYYENDNYERIYNGEFKYSGNVEKFDGIVFNINGNFSDNLKEGKWEFSVENIKSPVLQILGQKEKAALQFVLGMGTGDMTQKEIQGLQKAIHNGSVEVYQTYSSNLSGNYVAGKLDGPWTFKEISTGGKDVELTNEKNSPINSTVSFNENHLTGNFSYKRDEKNYVIGQFNQIGDLVGKWITKYISDGNEFENISEYDNGILIKMIERNTSTGEILSQDIQTDSKGQNLLRDAILFWVNDAVEFDKLPISKRNYMFKFYKGIEKPKSDYNF